VDNTKQIKPKPRCVLARRRQANELALMRTMGGVPETNMMDDITHQAFSGNYWTYPDLIAAKAAQRMLSLLLLFLLRLCFGSSQVILHPKLHNLCYQVEGNGLVQGESYRALGCPIGG